MKNIVENQGIKTDKPLAMSYEALKAERDAQQKRADALEVRLRNALISEQEAIQRAHAANQTNDALAVENQAMRNAIDFATAVDMWIEQHDGMFDYRYQEWYVDVLNAATETPATDAALASIQAQGVEKFADMCREKSKLATTADSCAGWKNCSVHASSFAIRLREAK
ncbi:hypothetical protein JY446_20425 [Serratia marcescens]|nr:hypothetical protein [Serratia marcescens]